MLSGRGLCDELITRLEESYRLCCVVVCDLETSRIGAPYIYDISPLRVNEQEKNRFQIRSGFLRRTQKSLVAIGNRSTIYRKSSPWPSHYADCSIHVSDVPDGLVNTKLQVGKDAATLQLRIDSCERPYVITPVTAACGFRAVGCMLLEQSCLTRGR